MNCFNIENLNYNSIFKCNKCVFFLFRGKYITYKAIFLIFRAILFKSVIRNTILYLNFIHFMTIFKPSLITLFLLFLLTLNSCGIYKKTDAKNIPTNADDRIKKNMEEGRGFRLGSLGNKSNTFQFASSNPLWRASLEKLSFAPLDNVDYAGGIIVTDWFGEGNSNEQIKITIRFLTNEIRSDAIRVLIHKKNCNSQNKCNISKVETDLNSEVKMAILKKAAQIKNEDLTITKDKNKEYKLPKNF